jgi:hypothetical protein
MPVSGRAVLRRECRRLQCSAAPGGATECPLTRYLIAQIVRRVYRRLVANGWLIEDQEQPWLHLKETDALDPLRAASVR